MFRTKRGKKLLNHLQAIWRVALVLPSRSEFARVGFIVNFIWIAGALSAVSANTKIILRPEVEITDQRIRLGDIARIETDDENLRQKLEAIDIGRANPAGRPRTITIPHIQVRIAGGQLDASQYTFVGSKSVVQYKAHKVSPDSILEAAKAFYREQFNFDGHDTEFQIEPKMHIRPMDVPSPHAKLKFVPLGEDLWKGNLEVQAIHNDRVADRAVLRFQLSVTRPVVVAARNIPRRMVIKPEHLKLERRSIENTSESPLTTLDEVIGKTAGVVISQGEVITASHLNKTYLVSRGAAVTLIAQRGSLKVQAAGKALEKGEQGQLVRVMNLTSKKELVGEVIGDKLVRIHF
ncbi:MAG: flagellar basal body P-ring formation chaperone FlgA [Candidatus Poribacteria bacterium]|nr:flagellar basal body P-ring formation chaperone FlgA [Candidatus Poribacteria bacterium]